MNQTLFFTNYFLALWYLHLDVGMALTYNQQPSTDVILTTSQQLLLPGYEEESGIATGKLNMRLS